MTATTWDTNHKTNTTLSGGSLVATSSGAGGVMSTRPMQGKTYSEHTLTTLTGTPSVGFAASSWNTSTDLKSGTNTLAFLPSGAVQVNGTTLSTIAAYVGGNRIDKSHDPANRLIWFRVAGGNWNNNAANDPATGVGGIDYSGALTANGTLWDAVYASLTGNIWTSAFSSGSFAGTAPGGFSSLDSVLYTLAMNTSEHLAQPLVAQTIDSPFRSTALKKYLRAFSPSGPLTFVSGLVEEGGTVVSGRRVDVYDRDTGELLGTAFSAVDGSWSVCCLGRHAVRIDGSDPMAFNALTFDNVVPI